MTLNAKPTRTINLAVLFTGSIRESITKVTKSWERVFDALKKSESCSESLAADLQKCDINSSNLNATYRNPPYEYWLYTQKYKIA